MNVIKVPFLPNSHQEEKHMSTAKRLSSGTNTYDSVSTLSPNLVGPAWVLSFDSKKQIFIMPDSILYNAFQAEAGEQQF